MTEKLYRSPYSLICFDFYDFQTGGLEGLSYFRFMRPLLKIFFTGMLVSFLGSLPLGTLNVAAMQISVSDGVTAAMLFSLDHCW